jgi:hypothetical protein
MSHGAEKPRRSLRGAVTEDSRHRKKTGSMAATPPIGWETMPWIVVGLGVNSPIAGSV